MNSILSFILVFCIIVPTFSKFTFAPPWKTDSPHQPAWIGFKDKGPSIYEFATNRDKKEINAPVYAEYVEEVKRIIGASNIRTESKWLNSISVVATVEELHTIASLPFVKEIEPLHTMKRELPPHLEIPQSSLQQIRSSQEKKAADPQLIFGNATFGMQIHNILPLIDSGLDGAGVRVLVIDSGFRKSHDCFANMNLIAERDFINSDNNTENEECEEIEQERHGTSVLSILACNVPGIMVGVCKNAEYLLAKTEIVSGTDVHAEEDYFISALEWGAENNAHIATASVGYYIWYDLTYYDGYTTKTTLAVNTATKDFNMVVVTSVGNLGAKGLAPPSDAIDVISVGALDDSLVVPAFSSKGPTFDQRIKPEICALGTNVFVAIPNDTNTFNKASGTSLSAPYITGIAVLLFQQYPGWSARTMRTALMSTSNQASNPDLLCGWGLVNASAAFYFNKVAVTTLVCANNCSFPNGLCTSDGCVCLPKYFNYDCSYERANCSNYCDHGKCYNTSNFRNTSAYDICYCYSGYYGVDCSLKYSSSTTSVLPSLFGVLGSIFVIAAIVVVLYVVEKDNILQNLRFVLYLLLAIGIPLLDITISKGILTPLNKKHELYVVTVSKAWEAVRFFWKLYLAVLVFPGILSFRQSTILALFGMFWHIAVTYPQSIFSFNKESTEFKYAIAISASIGLNTLMDYVILPLSIRFFQKKKAQVGISRDFSKESELDDFETSSQETPKPTSQHSLIEKVTYGCIAAYILFFFLYNLLKWKKPVVAAQIIRTQDACPVLQEFNYVDLSITALLILFLPIGFAVFLDRKRTFQGSFSYFYLYLFLVGSFATVPIEIVSNFYVLFEGKFAAINLILAVFQSIFMQCVTILAKKAAKNMSSLREFPPFVFRYQFFEDFLALLLYMRRDYREWLFWVFLGYQATWTVLRNSGNLDKAVGFIKNLLGKILNKKKEIDPEQLIKNQIMLQNRVLIASQYAGTIHYLNEAHFPIVGDLVSVISIPAQTFLQLKLHPSYGKIIGKTTEDSQSELWQMYLIIGGVKCLCHILVWAILQRRIKNHNKEATKGLVIESYLKMAYKNLKKYGLLFTFLSFVSAIDGFVAASLIFSSTNR